MAKIFLAYYARNYHMDSKLSVSTRGKSYLSFNPQAPVVPDMTRADFLDFSAEVGYVFGLIFTRFLLRFYRIQRVLVDENFHKGRSIFKSSIKF